MSKRPRIAIGGFMHESNTFAPGATDLGAFEAGGLEVGDGIRSRWGQAHHEVGGFLEAAEISGFDVVPTVMAWATPAGPVTARAYEEITGRILESLKKAGPVDAVLIALHGAMVAEGRTDADGETFAKIREVIGPNRPLIGSLDYHGNVSPLAVESTDALVAYRTYPHVDQRARGLKAGTIARRAATGEIRPTQALRKPPLLIHLLKQETDREPMKSLIEELRALDEQPGMLDSSIWAGFPYADVSATGVACVTVTDNDRALAEETVERIAERLWSLRKELTATPPEAPEAVRLALAAERTPVVLVDIGDNIGGGSAADSTVLIHELARQGATGSIVVLFDPDAVSDCRRVGVGEDVSIDVGGKVDRNASPFPLRGRIRMLHDGKYVEEQARHGGLRFNDQGLTAVVEREGGAGNLVVLTTRRHPPFSLGQLTSLGLDPRAARIITVKAAIAYKAAYVPIAGTIIEVDTPGLTASNPARYHYEKMRRPIFPLDPDTTWKATDR